MTSFVMQISFLKEQPPQNEVNINSGSWENIAMQLEILLTPKPFPETSREVQRTSTFEWISSVNERDDSRMTLLLVTLLCPEDRHKSYYRSKLQISVMEIRNYPFNQTRPIAVNFLAEIYLMCKSNLTSLAFAKKAFECILQKLSQFCPPVMNVEKAVHIFWKFVL